MNFDSIRMHRTERIVEYHRTRISLKRKLPKMGKSSPSRISNDILFNEISFAHE